MGTIQSNTQTQRQATPTRGGQTETRPISQSRKTTERGPSSIKTPAALERPSTGVQSEAKNSRQVTQQQSDIAQGVTGKQEPAPDPRVISKASDKLYKAMHGGWGYGTDEKAIFQALDGMSPAEVEALTEEYKDHYGKDLRKDLRGELSGLDEKRAMAQLSSNHDGADADGLRLAMKGWGTNEADIMSILKGKKPGEIRKLKEQYRKRHGRSLETDLKSELSGRDWDQARALMKSDSAMSEVANLQRAMEGWGTNEEAIYKALEGKTPDQRKAIMDAYKKKTGRDLSKALKSELSGADLVRAKSSLDGKTADVEAAKLVQATKGWGTDEDKINRVLEGKTQEERDAVAKAYKEQTGRELQSTLRSEMSGNDLKRSQSLLKDGQLTAAERLHFATDGLGTDEAAIRETLAGKSKSEIAQIKSDFRKKYGRDLTKLLDSELSGRDEFEAKIALEGKPENAMEALDIANRRTEYERSGILNGASRAIMGTFTDHGRMLDRNTDRANYYAAEAQRDGVMTKAEEDRLNQLVGFQSADVDTYKEAKDAIGDGLATAVSATAAVTATVLSAGAAAPILAGAISRVVMKGAVSGRSYDTVSALKDVAIGAAEGLGAKGGSLLGKMAREKVENLVLNKSMRVLLTATVDGAADGAVGGAFSGMVGTGMQDETWDDGFLTGLGRTGGSGFMGGVAGGVTGGVLARPMEIGLGKAAQGWAHLRGKGTVAMVEGAAKLGDDVADAATPMARQKSMAFESTASQGTRGASNGSVKTPESLPTIETPKRELSYNPQDLSKSLKDSMPEGMERDVLADVASRKRMLAEIEDKLQSIKDPAERAALQQAADEAKKMTTNEEHLSLLTEMSITRQADDLVKTAKEAGTISGHEYSTLLRDSIDERSHVNWRIFQEMDQQGLINPAIRKSLKKKMSPFKVVRHEGFEAVDKFYGLSSKRGNFDPKSSRQIRPNRVTVTQKPSQVMAANRILDKTSPEVVTSGGGVKLYQAGPDDIEVAKLSVARMEEMAPNLLPSLKEIHFARSTGSEVVKYAGNGRLGLPSTHHASTTLGYMNGGLNEGGIIVRKGAGVQSPASYRAKQANLELENAFRMAEANDINLTSESIKVLKKMAHENAQKAPVPDHVLPLNARTGTTIHEAAHHFDKARGTDGKWFSEGPDSGFGKGKFSESGDTDFVSDYASTEACEDFAETARFLANFPYLKDKPQLGLLSEALMEKIRKTGDVMGTPKDQVEALIKHYNG